MRRKTLVQCILEMLLINGFRVHYYHAKTTSSIYLKLDGGVANSVRIANHNGKDYDYMFNIRLDKKGYGKNRGRAYVKHTYGVMVLDKFIEDVKQNRERKIKKYGKELYRCKVVHGIENMKEGFDEIKTFDDTCGK